MTEDNTLKEFETLDIEPLIAPYPLEKRDNSRLLVINRKENKIEHRIFNEVIEYFNEGDCLVLNETKVVKHKLIYATEEGAKKDLLLVEKKDEYGNVWKCLAKKLKDGKKYKLEGGINIVSVSNNKDGGYTVTFDKPITEQYIEEYGNVPLPNYIIKKRKETNISEYNKDEQKYQTVYAKEKGSIAAPTAGFHFTNEIIEKLSGKGVVIARITLHIGYGTFKMVREDPSSFIMPSERCKISEKSAYDINTAKKNGKKIFAVGTSSMRTIEKMSDEKGTVISGSAESDIFIKPGYKFKVADCFITNLHVPNSPPLYMTAAFAGRELLYKAYKEAVKEKYRFYSYGDSCLII
ncbi:MAG: tRNA preQ1(34) S-adenosylmethionine ribosyltransferase-isomerase QueA [Elusimicrobiota bacterium]